MKDDGKTECRFPRGKPRTPRGKPRTPRGKPRTPRGKPRTPRGGERHTYLKIQDLDFSSFASLDKEQQKIIPVIVQHVTSKEVLMLAYVNVQALQMSLAKNKVILWSRSRKSLWVKGESSGDTIEIQEVRVNCEGNALLFLGLPITGSVCHTSDAKGKRRSTCFYRNLHNLHN